MEKTFILQGFKNNEHDQVTIQRLLDLGLHAGLEFQIIRELKVSNVIVIQFHQTLVALNQEEFSCLRY